MVSQLGMVRYNIFWPRDTSSTRTHAAEQGHSDAAVLRTKFEIQYSEEP